MARTNRLPSTAFSLMFSLFEMRVTEAEMHQILHHKVTQWPVCFGPLFFLRDCVFSLRLSCLVLNLYLFSAHPLYPLQPPYTHRHTLLLDVPVFMQSAFVRAVGFIYLRYVLQPSLNFLKRQDVHPLFTSLSVRNLAGSRTRTTSCGTGLPHTFSTQLNLHQAVIKSPRP